MHRPTTPALNGGVVGFRPLQLESTERIFISNSKPPRRQNEPHPVQVFSAVSLGQPTGCLRQDKTGQYKGGRDPAGPAAHVCGAVRGPAGRRAARGGWGARRAASRPLGREMGRERAGQARLWRAWAVVAGMLAGSARAESDNATPDESGVYTLTDHSLKPFIESMELSMVYFWAPFNTPSVTARSTILEVAKLAADYRPTIRVGSINCNDHRGGCGSLSIQAFPHLGYYSAGVGAVGDFP